MSNSASFETVLRGALSFYAQKKYGKFTGNVMVVNHEILNGVCPAAIACLPGAVAGASQLPVVTWIRPSSLDKCEKVSAEQACVLDPSMMRFVGRYNRSTEFRAMYAAEERKPGRSPIQRAEISADAPNVADNFRAIYGH